MPNTSKAKIFLQMRCRQEKFRAHRPRREDTGRVTDYLIPGFKYNVFEGREYGFGQRKKPRRHLKTAIWRSSRLSSRLFEKRAAGLYHNTAAIIDWKAVLGKYRKMHGPDDPLREVLLRPWTSVPSLSTARSPLVCIAGISSARKRRG
jgi:hypothetical protein